jgi:hypothetical protein
MGITTIEKDGKQLYRYEWQPTLDDGTPIGGVQVVEDETYYGLIQKQADNYNHLYRKNRELLRKEKLEGKAPDGAAMAPQPVSFQPRALTAEERYRLSRELHDPEKVDAALDLALEAKFGAKPKSVSDTVNSNASYAALLHAEQQAAAWKDMHPEYHASVKNNNDIVSWVKNRNMNITIENLDKALEDLLPALEVSPSVARTIPTPESATTDSRITAPDGRATQRQHVTPPIPTTVPRKLGTTHGETKKDVVTIEQFRKMSNQEQKKFVKANPIYFNK